MQIDYLNKLISDYPALETCRTEILKALRILVDCAKNNNKILTCGNGGSAADAEHIVGELLKGFHLKRELSVKETQYFKKVFPEEWSFLASNIQQAIPAISLVTNISFLTAFINDMNPDFIFAQQVYALGSRGDILVAISTSGNSQNIIYAAKIAKIKGLKIISLTGESGGKLAALSDITIKAPSPDVARIQELHLPVYHCLCALLEQEIFSD